MLARRATYLSARASSDSRHSRRMESGGHSLIDGMSLLFPPDILQPFPLSFRRDDIHIMAFIVGHPLYEAVEAMISAKPGGAYAIRAILTRHDQSQIDHVNDDDLFEAMQGTQREQCKRPIIFERQAVNGSVRARLDFVSHRDEPVILDVRTIGPADKTGSGLTDPGRHSPQSSLPIMYREASTLAGPETQVSIGGICYPVPTKFERGSFKALEGFYTEGHVMAAVRAGLRTMTVVERPSQMVVGARWAFDSDGRTVRYRIDEHTDQGISLSDDRVRERIRGKFCDGRLALARVERAFGDSVLAVEFGDGRFCFSLSGVGELVSGHVFVSEVEDRTLIRLAPDEPPWTRARPVSIACARLVSTLNFATTIGVADTPL